MGENKRKNEGSGKGEEEIRGGQKKGEEKRKCKLVKKKGKKKKEL